MSNIRNSRKLKTPSSPIPMFAGSRDENYIIDYDSVMLNECEKVFYGLMYRHLGKTFPGVRDVDYYDPMKIYQELGFYHGVDLLYKLKGVKDAAEWKSVSDISEEEVFKVINQTYQYQTFQETAMRHYLMETAMFDFVKSVTVVFNRPIRKVDVEFLIKTIPKSVAPKLILSESSFLQTITDKCGLDVSNFQFTTFVSSEMDDFVPLVSQPDIYKVRDCFLILRNHSGNTKMVVDKDQISFEPQRSDEILHFSAKNTSKVGEVVLSRFEPKLYKPVEEKETF